MTAVSDRHSSLEAVLKEEILHLYEAVASDPDQDFHFFHGREAAERFGYGPESLEWAPRGAVDSFAGVGNPHERADLATGESVLDLGSGAGLDSLLACRQVGPEGTVVGVDVNPTMLEKARQHAIEVEASVEFREGRMEALPAEDGGLDVIISNGVVNLSFRKRRVIEEMYRSLKAGGRLSITDIVSARKLSQSIVNDPKLWAS